MIRVAINGFGRIGRCALRQIEKLNDIEVVAINDLSDSLQLAYLYKYDSVHRTNDDHINYEDDKIIVNNKEIKIFKEEDPRNLPWGKLNIDVVLECSGVFTSSEKSLMHINAGAKRVIISAPSKDETKTIVFGVNQNILSKDDKIISCASCTTNCLAPIVNIINNEYGIVTGFMTTVHAMTNDQETLDIPHKKGIESRRGRAASLNIIPTSTGAAKSIGDVIPELKGKIDGMALRVPVGDGSLIDLSLEIEKHTTVDEVNKLFKNNQNDVIRITNAPIVSSDIIGSLEGAIVDSLLTSIVSNKTSQILKVVAWYDNEMGYTAQMLRVLKYFVSL